MVISAAFIESFLALEEGGASIPYELFVCRGRNSTGVLTRISHLACPPSMHFGSVMTTGSPT